MAPKQREAKKSLWIAGFTKPIIWSMRTAHGDSWEMPATPHKGRRPLLPRITRCFNSILFDNRNERLGSSVLGVMLSPLVGLCLTDVYDGVDLRQFCGLLLPLAARLPPTQADRRSRQARDQFQKGCSPARYTQSTGAGITQIRFPK